MGKNSKSRVLVKYGIDSDGDGLSDYNEIFTYLTDPHNSDSDRDGYL